MTPNIISLIPMRKPRIPLKPEDLSDGLRTSLREDGSSMLERRDLSRRKLEKVKSDQRFLNSETNLMLIHKPPLMKSLKKRLTKKPLSLPNKKKDKRKKLMLRKRRRSLQNKKLLRKLRLMMLLLEKLPKKLVQLKTRKFMMLRRPKRRESQLKLEPVMTALPRKMPRKKLPLLSAHQSSKVCAEWFDPFE